MLMLTLPVEFGCLVVALERDLFELGMRHASIGARAYISAGDCRGEPTSDRDGAASRHGDHGRGSS